MTEQGHNQALIGRKTVTTSNFEAVKMRVYFGRSNIKIGDVSKGYDTSTWLNTKRKKYW